MFKDHQGKCVFHSGGQDQSGRPLQKLGPHKVPLCLCLIWLCEVMSEKDPLNKTFSPGESCVKGISGPLVARCESGSCFTNGAQSVLSYAWQQALEESLLPSAS